VSIFEAVFYIQINFCMLITGIVAGWHKRSAVTEMLL